MGILSSHSRELITDYMANKDLPVIGFKLNSSMHDIVQSFFSASIGSNNDASEALESFEQLHEYSFGQEAIEELDQIATKMANKINASLKDIRDVTAESEDVLKQADVLFMKFAAGDPILAKFLNIQNEKIDVVVDPIIKIEYNPLKLKKQYKATIIGFAGKFEERPTLLDESMMYTIDDIEKFKLMYDPSFLDYYYRQPLPQGGDVYNYYIKSGVPGTSVAPAKAPAKASAVSKTAPSIMLKNQAPARSFKPFNSNELRKAKQLRDAGIGLMVGGAAVCLGAGLPVLFCLDHREAGIDAGIALISAGACLTTYVGIPMVCVGAVRYNRLKQEQSMQFTLNTGANGIGLGLTF